MEWSLGGFFQTALFSDDREKVARSRSQSTYERPFYLHDLQGAPHCDWPNASQCHKPSPRTDHKWGLKPSPSGRFSDWLHRTAAFSSFVLWPWCQHGGDRNLNPGYRVNQLPFEFIGATNLDGNLGLPHPGFGKRLWPDRTCTLSQKIPLMGWELLGIWHIFKAEMLIETAKNGIEPFNMSMMWNIIGIQFVYEGNLILGGAVVVIKPWWTKPQ